MTEEQLTKANKLKHQIDEIQKQYDVIEAILARNTVTITHSNVGSVILPVSDVMPALTYIQDILTQAKESAQEEFNEL